jgi:hypothetical protein
MLRGGQDYLPSHKRSVFSGYTVKGACFQPPAAMIGRHLAPRYHIALSGPLSIQHLLHEHASSGVEDETGD